MLDEFHHLDGFAQADLVRRREVPPSELAEAAIARIEALNPALNAVVHRCYEQGRAAAVSPPDGPLRGVPFLLKDSGPGQAEIPMTRANVALKALDHRPAVDSPIGARMRARGLVTLGVTNVPEFGQLGDTQPLAHGPARNPWDLDRSPAGSSGGAAAAVAAGMVPMAQGGDSAGSIRAPAAWCGVVGLKTTRGRGPRPVGRIDDLFSSQLVLTRTVRDTALALDALHGALPGDLFAQAPPARPYLQSLRPPRPLRIGVLADGPAGMPMHPECIEAVEVAARLLEQRGHRVEAAWPTALLEQIPDEVNRVRHDVLFRDLIAELDGVLGRPVEPDDVEPYTWTRFAESRPISADELRDALGWHMRRGARMLEWWAEGFDLLVTAPLNDPPELLRPLAEETPHERAATERRHAMLLEPFNASGQPAISVPVHRTRDGLPVGVQIAADRGREDLLLAVAAQLEESTRWPERWPDVDRLAQAAGVTAAEQAGTEGVEQTVPPDSQGGR